MRQGTTAAATQAQEMDGGAGAAWHNLDGAEVEQQLETGGHGLAQQETEARLRRYGPNLLEEEPPAPVWWVFLRQLRNPLIFILLLALVVTLLLGEYLDASVIAAVLGLNAVIGFTQERKAEGAVRALMQLVVPRARVVRDGRDREIDSRDLVPGDVVLLESGVRIPADLRMVSTTALQVDESLLSRSRSPRPPTRWMPTRCCRIGRTWPTQAPPSPLAAMRESSWRPVHERSSGR